MTGQDCSRKEKFFQYRTKKQSRPFVDKDLQIQLPGIETVTELESAVRRHPSYFHYLKESSSPVESTLYVCQLEWNKTMAEAQQAYANWKHLQQELQKIVQASRSGY